MSFSDGGALLVEILGEKQKVCFFERSLTSIYISKKLLRGSAEEYRRWGIPVFNGGTKCYSVHSVLSIYSLPNEPVP